MGPSLYEPLAAVYRPPEGVPLEWEVLVRSRPYGLTVLVLGGHLCTVARPGFTRGGGDTLARGSRGRVIIPPFPWYPPQMAPTLGTR